MPPNPEANAKAFKLRVVQVVAAKFMEDIGTLCDLRFAALSSEPGGDELISFHHVIANDGLNDLEAATPRKFNAETG